MRQPLIGVITNDCVTTNIFLFLSLLLPVLVYHIAFDNTALANSPSNSAKLR